MKKQAPIALFVYNRPEKTGNCLTALAKNPEIAASTLYVFCDGPKDTADGKQQQLIMETRETVRRFSSAAQLIIHESSRNLGLAESIKAGIGMVLDSHETVIVLEDDIQTSPGFLSYMNAALEVYAHEAQVGAICGYLPNVPFAWTLRSTFFLHHFECWGWGTWDRVWKSTEWDAAKVLAQVKSSEEHLKRLNFEGAADFCRDLYENAHGRLKTWAIVFQSNICLRDQLCLFPHRSLVVNIGFDGTGENCGWDDSPVYSVRPADSVRVVGTAVRESAIARFCMRRFLLSLKARSLQAMLRQTVAKLRSKWGQRR